MERGEEKEEVDDDDDDDDHELDGNINDSDDDGRNTEMKALLKTASRYGISIAGIPRENLPQYIMTEVTLCHAIFSRRSKHHLNTAFARGADCAL